MFISRNYIRFGLGLYLFICSCSCMKRELPLVKESDKLFVALKSSYTGVHFENNLVETQEENHLVNEDFVTGSGVAIGDVNNDGLLDIYFGGNQVNDKLYLNKGNFIFEDITDKFGILESNSWSTGVTFVDINSDGYLDIYVCKNVQGNPELSKNLLYINNKGKNFTEEGQKYNLNDAGFAKQAHFFDYNKDGKVDLYLVNQPPGFGNRKGGKDKRKFKNIKYSDKLYENLGENNGFLDVSIKAKIANAAHGLSAAIGDVNNDGWQDIYVANDYDEPDYMYINMTDGTFKEVLKKSFKHISNFSMGSDIADYDNDGFLDILVLDMVAEDHKRIKTNMGGMRPENFHKIVENGGHYQYMFNTLQRNNGNGVFSDLAQIGGVSNTDWSWGPLFADFDNDGKKDIFITNGVKRNMRNSDLNIKYESILDSISIVAKKMNKKFQDVVDVLALAQMAPEDKLSNFIFKNNGDYTFSKKVEDWGVTELSLSNGASYADLDNDGDLDLVVSNIDEEAFIYRNTTIEKGDNSNFLRFSLKPVNSQSLYGTKIILHKDKKAWQTIELVNARGYMSKSEDVAHFGLGELSLVEKVTIIWPNGQQSVKEEIEANQHLIVVQGNTKNGLKQDSNVDSIFKNITSKINLKHLYKENVFNDYKEQVLLPHKMSQFGPSIAVGDVNGDNLEDFFVGGSAGNSGSLYLQQKSTTFIEVKEGAWTLDKNSEDMGCIFVDIDKDNDLDLFVVSGGYEFKEDSKELQDRLYLNDGKGNFTKDKTRVPSYSSSGSIVTKADFDKDGDLDLFIGGRQVPGKYPLPASSILLENVDGYFRNVTGNKAKDLKNLGMVTASVWVDLNSDDLLDLVIVGEWMPLVALIQNKKGIFERKNFKEFKDLEGWYFSVNAADMDNDGDNDLILGNLGLNYKYKASAEKPFQVHSYDFDANGSNDIVLSYHEENNVYPIRGRSCSIEQVPKLRGKFPTFESFGNSNLKEIYGTDLDKALHLKAKNFASIYIENIDGKAFKIKELPKLAQVSSINSILIEDYNKDGNKDVLITGNLFSSEIETPRNDAGIGLLLKGDGVGNFNVAEVNESGFFTPHDAKDMRKIKIGENNAVIVANNNYYLQIFKY